ncbi:hypothetical protein SDC9_190202 [bioreactor metagenome]|uniref:Uncharacterized protein n=1 Tax=bioreactor metagenome TaxID=1076179 RepID=A0A645HUB5_9ZZZZ
MARLESCGVFSVIKIEDKEPLTKRDFEEFVKSIQDNPLSPLGEKWAKMEQMSEELQQIKTMIQSQQLSTVKGEELNLSNKIDLH